MRRHAELNSIPGWMIDVDFREAAQRRTLEQVGRTVAHALHVASTTKAQRERQALVAETRAACERWEARQNLPVIPAWPDVDPYPPPLYAEAVRAYLARA